MFFNHQVQEMSRRKTDGSSAQASGMELQNDECVTLSSVQRIRPYNNEVDLGSASKRFKTLYYTQLDPIISSSNLAGPQGVIGPQGFYGSQGTQGFPGPPGTRYTVHKAFKVSAVSVCMCHSMDLKQ